MFNPTKIKERTQEMRNLIAAAAEPAPDETPALDPKQEAIIAALHGGSWGCQRESVFKLVSAIIGVDIPVSKPSKPERDPHFVIGAAFALAGHTYIIRDLDGDGDAQFINKDGGSRTYDGIGYMDCADGPLEPATDEQIDAFFS